jgi:serine/threonine protein phosphatase 1
VFGEQYEKLSIWFNVAGRCWRLCLRCDSMIQMSEKKGLVLFLVRTRNIGLRRGEFRRNPTPVTFWGMGSKPYPAGTHLIQPARNSVAGRPEKPRVELPEGTRIYVVGEIHGRADLLDRVLAKIDLDIIARPGPRSLEVFIGDYIDRGMNSKLVIEHLIRRSYSRKIIFLKGNHEAYLCEFLKSPAVLNTWRQYGALETLVSYGLTPSIIPTQRESVKLAATLAERMPNTHKQFLQTLQSSFSCGGYFFAHAGVNPAYPLSQQRDDDLLWIRDRFLLCNNDFGQIVVHGHTPVPEPEIRANRINVDTGAYATGRLTCLVLERDQVGFL